LLGSVGSASGGLARSGAALTALLALAAAAHGQFGVIQREQKVSSTNGRFTGPIGNDYRFGVSVAELGDFDGDGIRDLVVGSHRADIGGEERGAVWLLYLNADGTVRAQRQISARVGGFVGPLDDHDRLGISVCSLGDLDLDGTIDIAVGAYRDDDGGTDFGCVYVLFLTPQGTVKAQQKISALEGGLNATLKVEDSFGWSVENIGDLDDDGVIDLAVGATRDDGQDPDPTKDYGALYLLYLNVDGTVKSSARIGVETPGFGSVLRTRDRFGSDVVLLQDADRDGVEDIAVGAFGEDPLKYGKVFVLHLERGGGVRWFQEIGANTGGFTGVLGKGDRFGISLAADDLDGDGLHDLVIGAAGDDDGGAGSGAVWVCLLDRLGRVHTFQKISSDRGGFGGLLHPEDNFGISCATLGDVDRDGAVDLAVGAYQDDDGGFDRGATWVLFRAGTGAPVADFVSRPSAGDVPLTVTFSDRSSGPITAWSWDFGDGETSSEPSPVHVYSTPGVRDVRLTVHGPRGSDTLLRQRAVVAQAPVLPEADFAAAPSSGTTPLTVSFFDLSRGSVSAWSWDFGDGATSTLRNAKHVYDGVGTYGVTLTVMGALGTSSLTLPELIRVDPPPPTPDFAAEPTFGPPPLEVRFRDLSTPDTTSWSWTFGDGQGSTEREPVHVYAAYGSYDVTLLASGPSGSRALTRPGWVTVGDPVYPAFDVASPGGLPPVTVQFFDRTVGAPTSWSWDFGDGATSSARNPAHTFVTGGTFLVRLTVTAPGTSALATASVAIDEPPPDARFSASVTAGDVPLRVQFTDLSLGNLTSWLWDFGDGTGSFEQSPRHVYRKAGVYTVRFRVWSAGGLDGVVRRDWIRVTGGLPTDRPPGLEPSGAPAGGAVPTRSGN
jgi:PKD repeat protein